jgi:hypothetical protein
MNGSRSYEEQRAFDFIRLAYATVKVGHRCATELLDRNISGETILYPVGRKPQSRRSLQQSLFGAKDWGRFLEKLLEVETTLTVEGPEEEIDSKDLSRAILRRDVLALFEKIKIIRKDAGDFERSSSLEQLEYILEKVYLELT